MKELLLNEVQNIVAKEEISHDELFLLLLQCFHMPSAAEAIESICLWESVKREMIFFQTV